MKNPISRLVTVIHTLATRGLGITPHDPVRHVDLYFSEDGRLLAEHDSWFSSLHESQAETSALNQAHAKAVGQQLAKDKEDIDRLTADSLSWKDRADGLEAELKAVDVALGNVQAFDSCKTRQEKVALAMARARDCEALDTRLKIITQAAIDAGMNPLTDPKLIATFIRQELARERNGYFGRCQELAVELDTMKGERDSLAQANFDLARDMDEALGMGRSLHCTWKGYVGLLGRSNEAPIRIAVAHGWECPKAEVEKGEWYRKEIERQYKALDEFAPSSLSAAAASTDQLQITTEGGLDKLWAESCADPSHHKSSLRDVLDAWKASKSKGDAP